MARTRVSTTVDGNLLAKAREATGAASDAALFDQALDALLGALALADVFVDANVVGQLAVFAMHFGDRQLAPVGVEVLPPALE